MQPIAPSAPRRRVEPRECPPLDRHSGRSHPGARWRWLVVVGLTAAAVLPSEALAARSPEIENAIQATVYVEVDRQFRGVDFVGMGSGFFISDDGFILTNYHVVGEYDEVVIAGRSFLIECTVLGIRVTVNPRTAAQKTFSARLVAADRKNDLALLKVKYEPEHVIRPVSRTPVDVLDEVVVIGFPLGMLMSFDEYGWPSSRGGVPEVSLSTGRIASIRKDETGRPVALQTDAAINPGNSGGPMVSMKGELAGVAYMESTIAEQVGFAISPNRIREFVEAQRVLASFNPPFVSRDRRSILISARGGALVGEHDRVVAKLTGDDIPDHSVELAQVDGEWRAAMDIPPRIPARPWAREYQVSIELLKGPDRRVAQRSFALRVTGDEVALGAGLAEEASIVIGNQITIQDYARKLRSRNQADEGVELGPAPTEVEDPGPPPGLDDALESVRQEARTQYRAGNYAGAARLLRDVLEIDPDDELSREFLQLAEDRARINDLVAAADSGAPTAVTTVPVTVTFDSPLRRGRIALKLDGEALPAVEFAFGRSTDGRRVSSTIELPAGDHVLEARLVDHEERCYGEFRFDRTFKPGTPWTLRINLPSPDAKASAYLVEQARP